MANVTWSVGQTVEVQRRTWAGINKEGGCAKITKIHYSDENNDAGNVEGLDVKYVVSGGTEKNVDPSIVSLHELLDRGGRKRRGREFLMERADDAVKKLAIEAIKKKNASKSNKNKSQKKGGGTLTKKKKQQPPEQQQAMESSPGPTSPSTPVTPDHKPKVAKKQVTVTSIPSYVNIGDGIVEVSPLPVDRSCMAKSKPAVARRGLFGGGSEPTIANNHQKSTSKSKSKVDCVVAESTKKPAAEKKKMYAKSSTFGGMADKPTTITPGLKKKAPSKPQATNASNTAKIARRDVVESKKPPAMKQPLLQFPRPKPANHASKEGTRKPLKEVYEDEVKKAKKFLDDVMGARADDIIVDESKENKSAIMDEKKSPSRYHQFLAIFRSLRLKIDDGTIEETEFRKLVNEHTTSSKQPFSIAEVDAHIEALCEEGKMMKSDGTLYIID